MTNKKEKPMPAKLTHDMGIALDGAPLEGCRLLARTQPPEIAYQGIWDHIYKAAPDRAAAHPDDQAVDRFAGRMKEKLAKKRADGKGGWNDRDVCSRKYLSESLVRHVAKGDPVDVANFCMMLSERGDQITQSATAAGENLDKILVIELPADTESYKYKVPMAMMPLTDWEAIRALLEQPKGA